MKDGQLKAYYVSFHKKPGTGTVEPPTPTPSTDYQTLLTGTWGTVEDNEDDWISYRFKFDGSGQVTVYMDDSMFSDDDETTVAYTVDESGNISFTCTFGLMGDVTGTITLEGKLTLKIWGSDYTLTKK